MKENGENRGLKDKKAYEDQFTTFVSLVFGILILFSLSYSCTLRVSWSIVAYLGFGERRQRKSSKAQEDNGINSDNGFSLQVQTCMYDFLAIFGMHCICMKLFRYDLSLASRIGWIDNGFA